MVVAVALAVGVLVTAGSVYAVDQRNLSAFWEGLSSRTVTIRAIVDDTSAFARQTTVPLDVRLVGDIYTVATRLYFADLEAARAAAPSVDHAYVRTIGGLQSEGGVHVPAAIVSGEYLTAARVRVVAGELPRIDRFSAEAGVALMSERFGQELGLGSSVLDQRLYFQGREEPLTIVGVLPDLPGQMLSVAEALVPYEDRGAAVGELWFTVDDPSDLDAALHELEAFAASRWEGRVSVLSNRDQVLRAYRDRHARSLFIAAFAGLGLAVAMLNVSGLMLARVAQRERQIGIARSLGLTGLGAARAIVAEALAFAILGAFAGLVLGTALLSAYNRGLIDATGAQALAVPFSLSIALWAMILVVLLTLFAVAYPALCASRVRIVAALQRT